MTKGRWSTQSGLLTKHVERVSENSENVLQGHWIEDGIWVVLKRVMFRREHKTSQMEDVN